MKNKVYARIMSFGYALETQEMEDGSIAYLPTPVDKVLVDYGIDKVTRYITSECGTDTIPEELEFKAIDNVVGEFFMSKKATGQLAINDIDFSMAVKSINEGDTSVTFADGNNPSDMFNVLVNYLLQPIDLSDFRRIRW